MTKLYDVLHDVVQGQDISLQNYIDTAQNTLNSAISKGLIEPQIHASTMKDILLDQSSTLQVSPKKSLKSAKQTLIFKKRLQSLPVEKASILPHMQQLELGKCFLMLDGATDYKIFESLVITCFDFFLHKFVCMVNVIMEEE